MIPVLRHHMWPLGPDPSMQRCCVAAHFPELLPPAAGHAYSQTWAECAAASDTITSSAQPAATCVVHQHHQHHHSPDTTITRHHTPPPLAP